MAGGNRPLVAQEAGDEPSREIARQLEARRNMLLVVLRQNPSASPGTHSWRFFPRRQPVIDLASEPFGNEFLHLRLTHVVGEKLFIQIHTFDEQ